MTQDEYILSISSDTICKHLLKKIIALHSPYIFLQKKFSTLELMQSRHLLNIKKSKLYFVLVGFAFGRIQFFHSFDLAICIFRSRWFFVRHIYRNLGASFSIFLQNSISAFRGCKIRARNTRSFENMLLFVSQNESEYGYVKMRLMNIHTIIIVSKDK